ncbi:uncharacterized protein LOC134362501 [Cynocephalus volans]|uniref:uncharacterized protein LOC134362501 n=1 Tax=Cynocephalus volans TaxID=110931 RepID=UPI002FCBE8D2
MAPRPAAAAGGLRAAARHNALGLGAPRRPPSPPPPPPPAPCPPPRAPRPAPLAPRPASTAGSAPVPRRPPSLLSPSRRPHFAVSRPPLPLEPRPYFPLTFLQLLLSLLPPTPSLCPSASRLLVPLYPRPGLDATLHLPQSTPPPALSPPTTLKDIRQHHTQSCHLSKLILISVPYCTQERTPSRPGCVRVVNSSES